MDSAKGVAGTAILKKAWGAISGILIVAVILLGILLAGVRLVGLEPYTVLSGSMEPRYHVGSLIYVTKVDPMTLAVGDPITFYLPTGKVATHRIIEIVEDPSAPGARAFRTQGDANDTPDGDPVSMGSVIGKPVFTIPLLGYLALYIQQPPGRYVALGFCIVLLAAILLVDLVKVLLSCDKPADAAPAEEPPEDDGAEEPPTKP